MITKMSFKGLNFNKNNPANYFPPLIKGSTDDILLPYHKEWTSCIWELLSITNKIASVGILIYSGEKLSARAFFEYNTNTGWVDSFFAQNALECSTNLSIRTLREEKKKEFDVKKYIFSLIRSFKSANDYEYKKAEEERKIKEFQAKAQCVADQTDENKRKQTAKISTENVYDPQAPKSPVYIGSKKGGAKKYVMKEWQRHGYYRHYKSGKIVYIEPVIVHRKIFM